MSKRKSNFDHINKKIKKLKKMLNRIGSDSDSSSTTSSDSESLPGNDPTDVPLLNAENPAIEYQQLDEDNPAPNEITPTSPLPGGSAELPSGSNLINADQTVETNDLIEAENIGSEKINLDSDILEILGEDPSLTTQYGPEIHKELASRLQHITTSGLTKEARQELTQKYLVPSNSILIGAPTLNPEIKAALPETLVNRDKAIESKQKLLGNAISCLASATSRLLESNNKNNELLKMLMDANRMLCDVQHSDSVTRRMFSLSVVKKDVKSQIQNTKIDQLLFGESLPDTLKTAKAVSRSCADIKYANNNNFNKAKPSTSKTGHLNSKGPVGHARKPPATTQKTRQPAYHRSQHYKSYKTSYQQPRSTHRRH